MVAVIISFATVKYNFTESIMVENCEWVWYSSAHFKQQITDF